MISGQSHQLQIHQNSSAEESTNPSSILVTEEELNLSAFVDLCRFCSNKMNSRLNLFEKEAEQRQILSKVRILLPLVINKDDFLPKKVCEKCIAKIDQFYEWRQHCLNTESIFSKYAETVRSATASINYQDGIVNLDKMPPSQKNAFIDAHISIQQHISQANHFSQQNQLQQNQNTRANIKDIHHPQTSQSSSLQAYPVTSIQQQQQQQQQFSSLKIPQVSSNNSGTTTSIYTTIGDDGFNYDNGMRVLQNFGNLGSWNIPSNIPKPNLIPFTEPYVEGGSLNPNTKLHHHSLKHHTTMSTTRKSRNNHSTTAPKAFECTVCGKGLARKDKLTIHTRIHTGEKPYVCEICDKAFARRDKLVIHMNKFKHVTPTNIAPLGKRLGNNNLNSMIKKEHQNQQQNQQHQNNKPVIISHETKPLLQPPTSVDQTHLGIQSFQLHQIQNQSVPSLAAQNLQAQHHTHQTITNISQHQLWTCELCNRILPTREEWAAHAKAHMEVSCNTIDETIKKHRY